MRQSIVTTSPGSALMVVEKVTGNSARSSGLRTPELRDREEHVLVELHAGRSFVRVERHEGERLSDVAGVRRDPRVGVGVCRQKRGSVEAVDVELNRVAAVNVQRR
jgi:hypothetical protein